MRPARSFAAARLAVWLLAATAWASVASPPVEAHELRPGYLSIEQAGPERYRLSLKLPARGPDQKLAVRLRLPPGTQDLRPPVERIVDGSFVVERTVRHAGGLEGQTLHLDGLDATLTDVLVRVQRADGSTQVTRVEPASPWFVLSQAPGLAEVAGTYTWLGMEHIWLGIDHLLFVACLVWIARGPRKLLITITGFTVAHSITLALSVLDLVRLPAAPVEAVIALSIVFLAREIAIGDRSTLTFRRPVTVSAAFGLLHGFGFASALLEVGLPRTDLGAALLFFNVGVEIGQIVFVVALLAAYWLVRRAGPGRPSGSSPAIADGRAAAIASGAPGQATPYAAYAVGTLAGYWVVERVAGFWL